MTPLRLRVPSLPFTPTALLRPLAEETVTGGQNPQQPLALVHFWWRALSPLRVYTARPLLLTTMPSVLVDPVTLLVTEADLAVWSVSVLATARPTSAALARPATAAMTTAT